MVFVIFKIKYSAVAAGFALFFVGGYTTSHYLIADKTDYRNMHEVKNTTDNQVQLIKKYFETYFPKKDLSLNLFFILNHFRMLGGIS